MLLKYNTKSFIKTMDNIVDYSFGFIDGVKRGKRTFLTVLGKETVEALKQYIDINAKNNPKLLHHVYEWYKTGSPSARLYDIDYTISNIGLSFNSTFKQSKSFAEGSRVPFYDKARIMENGVAVTIRPKEANVLSFNVDGEQIFTPGPIVINNPGGNVKGEFERIFDSFFNQYFTQSFLRASGVYSYLENPTVFKQNIRSGAKIGRSHGVKTGYTWVANASIGVVK